MEIKAELKHPYTQTERIEFVVEYNHRLGYEIKEYTTVEEITETIENENTGVAETIVVESIINHIEAWGYTEEELAQHEKERVSMLNMTRGDFLEGLILAQGKDETDIIALIEQLPITDTEKKVYVNRVKNALDFYRGYPVIDVLASYLNVAPEQMDLFFETKDYKYLIPVEVEDENTTNTEQ